MLEKLARIIGVLLLTICLLSSCNHKSDNMDIKYVAGSIHMNDVITTVYTDEQLQDILCFDGNLQMLNQRYATECIRKINGEYRVVYKGDDKVCLLFFTEIGVKKTGKIYHAVLEKQSFDRFKAGMHLNEIREADATGDYTFLYTGRNDIPRVSTHCTKDGYIVFISYDENGFVTGINVELL